MVRPRVARRHGRRRAGAGAGRAGCLRAAFSCRGATTHGAGLGDAGAGRNNKKAAPLKRRRLSCGSTICSAGTLGWGIRLSSGPQKSGKAALTWHANLDADALVLVETDPENLARLDPLHGARTRAEAAARHTPARLARPTTAKDHDPSRPLATYAVVPTFGGVAPGIQVFRPSDPANPRSWANASSSISASARTPIVASSVVARMGISTRSACEMARETSRDATPSRSTITMRPSPSSALTAGS
jgi:hypothetical protein